MTLDDCSVSYLTALNQPPRVFSVEKYKKIIMNDKQRKTRKEAVVAYLKVIRSNWSENTDRNHDRTSVRTVKIPAETRIGKGKVVPVLN